MSPADLKAQFDSLFLDGLAVHRQEARSIDKNLTAIAVAEEKVLRRSRQDDTKAEGAQRILDAAAKVFREKGYAGTRLADVAAASGIQTGSMYYYFKSREHLVVEMLLVAWKRTDGLARLSVDALPADATALDRFSTALTAHLLSVLRNTMYTSALVRILGQIPDSVRDQTVNHQRAYLEYWRGLMEDAIASGEIRAGHRPVGHHDVAHRRPELGRRVVPTRRLVKPRRPWRPRSPLWYSTGWARSPRINAAGRSRRQPSNDTRRVPGGVELIAFNARPRCYRPRSRPMMSFMISVVPPKIV